MHSDWWPSVARRLKLSGKRAAFRHVDRLLQSEVFKDLTSPEREKIVGDMLRDIELRQYYTIAFWAPFPPPLRSKNNWVKHYMRARSGAEATGIPLWEGVDHEDGQQLILSYLDGLSGGFYEALSAQCPGRSRLRMPETGFLVCAQPPTANIAWLTAQDLL